MQFATWMEDINQDYIGGPFSQNEFKLVDVPDLNYMTSNCDQNGNPSPQGELWVRGPNVSLQYFGVTEDTSDTYTADGWLKTGDIAQIIHGYNSLKIID